MFDLNQLMFPLDEKLQWVYDAMTNKNKDEHHHHHHHHGDAEPDTKFGDEMIMM